MKLRKFAALGLAASLAVTPMTVFAADSPTPVEKPTAIGETAAGTMNYLPTTIYKVTVPTTSGLTFALDPQGLASVSDGASKLLSELENGGIVKGGNGAYCVNASSVPIKLTASFYLTDGSGKAPAATLVNTDPNDKATELLLQVIPAVKTFAKADVTSLSGGTALADAKWSATDAKAIMGTTEATATKVTFIMPAAEYKVKNASGTYTYEMTADAETVTAFKIGGKVSKAGDWSAFAGTTPKTLVLRCVFDVKPMTEGYDASTGTDKAISGSAAYLLQDDTKLFTELTQTITKASATNTEVTAAAVVKAATMTKLNGNNVNVPLNATHVTGIGTNKITLLATWLKSAAFVTGDSEVTFTFANGDKQILKITLS